MTGKKIGCQVKVKSVAKFLLLYSYYMIRREAFVSRRISVDLIPVLQIQLNCNFMKIRAISNPLLENICNETESNFSNLLSGTEI